jgi:hypothetical protein
MNAASQAAKVVEGLQQVTNGIGQATDKATQGVETARRAEGQALQVGYNRVAAGLADIRRRIEQLREILSVAGREAVDGVGIASGVTNEMTPEDAAKLMQDTVTKIEASIGHLERANHDVRNIERDVVMVLRGAKPEPLLACMKGVTDGIRHAGKSAIAAKTLAEATLEGGAEISGN